MKQLLVFIKKEITQLLRDRRTLIILFGMPIIQILIFGFSLTNEVKNSGVVVVDNAQDQLSSELILKIESNDYFNCSRVILSPDGVEAAFRDGSAKIAIVLPAELSKMITTGAEVPIQLITDSSDPNLATSVASYLKNIVNSFVLENRALASDRPITLDIETRMLYNPQLKGAPSFVPGVISLILMILCVMMTAISIVREKESGTMELILVTPFKPVYIIIAKVVPYIILSLINVTIIIILSDLVLGLPVKGSLLLLYAESTLFIITALTIGIFVSIKSPNQQVAMLISLMGMLLPTILFSGFMFPIENMPKALQIFSNLIPSKWFYIIVKSIMIKGLGFSYIWQETLILFGTTLLFLGLSLKKFQIRL